MPRKLLQSTGFVGMLAGMLAITWANNASAGVCQNEPLRSELRSVQLPDCRTYELVSPSVKYGQPIDMRHVSSSLSNGTRGVGFSLGAFSGSNQTSVSNYYEFTRDSERWETAPLNVPTGYVNAAPSVLQAASSDLGLGLFEYRQSTISDLGNTGFYIRNLPSGPPIKVGPRLPPVAFASGPVETSAPSSEPSASKDLSRVLFMLKGPSIQGAGVKDYLWPGDATVLNSSNQAQGYVSLYEYIGTNNLVPSLVGVDNNGHQISQCGTSLGLPSGASFTSLQGADLYNAISVDGSSIFFTAAARCNEGTGPPANELYARDELPSGEHRTVAISEPTTGQGGDCSACNTGSPQDAAFQGASADGSKVFFLSEQHLLGGSEGKNLYEYDFKAEEGKRVVLVAPNVQGVARISEDGSHVFFVSQSVLTNSANSVGDIAQSAKDNLYVYDTGMAETSFIGTLSAGDVEDWRLRDERPVDATPDGRLLVFTSSADLTADDTSSVSQVFEYDTQAKTLVHVSRANSGFAAVGGESEATIVRSDYTFNLNPAPQPSSISDDGAYVVFKSQAALTPQAAAGYNNVYEYHAGQVSLISDGQDHNIVGEGETGTTLVGIDSSGQDVFFTTGDRLVPQDGDTQVDVYDARIGGGIVSPTAPTACEGVGCRGTLAPSPQFTTGGGSTSQPPGEQFIEPLVAKTKIKSKTKKAKPRKKTRGANRRGKKSVHGRRPL